MYDFLIVGTGLFGSVFAYEATKAGKKCMVIDRRNHIGGNCYTYSAEGINVHKYGAHIFNTSNTDIWNYIGQFATFNRFTNTVIARYKNKLYNLPFNMNTFYQMWGVMTPQEAKAKIVQQALPYRKESPNNLEEHILGLVGPDVYEMFIKGYTEKQWGRPVKELPISTMARIPIRFTFDNNYYNTLYQGIPIGGYTQIFTRMLENCDVLLNEDFLRDKDRWLGCANKILFTGPIDEYYEYRLGTLEYRGLHFETETLPYDDYQGVAVVNYTEFDVPYTRIIEHKHFEFGKQDKTIITREKPTNWAKGDEAYYPINDDKNTKLYEDYKNLSLAENKVIFGGRLGSYMYTNMQDTIISALECAKAHIN